MCKDNDESMRNLVDPPALRAMREQQERMRDLVDPPALRAMREQQEQMRDLFDPPAMRAMREQQERMRDLFDPPALRVVREMQERMRDLIDPPALRVMRETQLKIRDLVDPPALRIMQETMEKIRNLSLVAPDVNQLVNRNAQAGLTNFARSAQALGLGSSVIEAALRRGCFEREADMVSLAANGISKLVPEISDPNIFASGELVNAGIGFLEPTFEFGTAGLVAEMPPEIFRALDLDIRIRPGSPEVAESERLEIAGRTTDELETTLADFDPQLITLLGGAREAAKSSNPDRARHVCISLRELIGHALRQLAPDPEVGAWTRNAEHFHNGKPTRKARIEYLYSCIEEPALRDFIAADIRAAIKLLDTLSKGSHVISFEASPTAMTVLMNRAEGMILLLLRLRSAQLCR